ncbi:MAG TPA: hypothetical protein VFW94_23765 [Candidatus Acidoferrales bacterium]|nr:hypothetical protein [Candidatus Acidoferrales bacterium]
MAYENTEVAVSKSQDGIRKLIYAHQGTGLMLLSQPPREGFEAMVKISDQDYHIRVMATAKPKTKDRSGWTLRGAKKAGAIEQENRRVWRVLYWHLKAMFEASDSGVIDVRDVIMPYVVLKDGMTLADHIKPQMSQLMNLDPARLLSAGV